MPGTYFWISLYSRTIYSNECHFRSHCLGGFIIGYVGTRVEGFKTQLAAGNKPKALVVDARFLYLLPMSACSTIVVFATTRRVSQVDAIP